MGHQHGAGGGTDRRNDAPGEVKLAHGLYQQRVIAHTLRALQPARQHNNVVIAIRYLNQRRVR